MDDYSDDSDDDNWINEECRIFTDSDTEDEESKTEPATPCSPRAETHCISKAFLQAHGEFQLLADKLLNRTTSMPFCEQFAPINELPACLMPLLNAASGSKYVVYGDTGCGKTTFTTLAMLHSQQKTFALSVSSLDSTTARDLTDSVARSDWTCVIDDIDDISASTAKLLTKCLSKAKSTLIFLCHTLSKHCKQFKSATQGCVYIHLRRSKQELQATLQKCGCNIDDAIRLARSYDQDFRSAMTAAEFTIASKGYKRLSLPEETKAWLRTTASCKFATVEDKMHLWNSLVNIRNNSNAFHSALLASDRDVNLCNMATQTYLCSAKTT